MKAVHELTTLTSRFIKQGSALKWKELRRQNFSHSQKGFCKPLLTREAQIKGLAKVLHILRSGLHDLM